MTRTVSRRNFMIMSGAVGIAVATGARAAPLSSSALSPVLLGRALAAFSRHRDGFTHVDRIGIVDFAKASLVPRLFIVDIATGEAHSHLVAHGRGSDPTRTGWAQSFSNEPGSLASSSGAFITGAEYRGRHGRSLHLSGLDPENCNAKLRAIVVHSAWYVSPQIAADTGMLGRSEGCFAVSDASLSTVLDQLGPGRLLFAGKA